MNTETGSMGEDIFRISILWKFPKKHKDHDKYFRIEAPSWESNKVGYRRYLNQQNAVDI